MSTRKYDLAEFLPIPKRLKQSNYRNDLKLFKNGSIVSCKLTNFMSYKFTKFNFGPKMNLIIGPNGTGKSTFVCAVCIGLAGKLAWLGKEGMSTDDFIKDSESRGEIELELKSNNDIDSTIVIKSVLIRGSKTEWYLNSRSVSENEVKKVLKGFNIQLDNLCQFLPQDRVSKFADMKGEELLKEVERSYGDGSLLVEHEEVEKLKLELANEIKLFEESKLLLVELREKNQVLTDNVKKHEKFLKLEKELEEVKLILPYIEYQETKQQKEDAVNAFENGRAGYEEFSKMIKPFEKELGKSAEKQKVADDEVTKLTSMSREKTVQLEKLRREIKDINNYISDKFNEIEEYEQTVRERKKRYFKIKEEYQRVNEDFENFEVVDDSRLEEIKEERRVIRNELMEIEDLLSSEKGKVAANEKIIDRLKREILNEERKLNSTDRLNLLDNRKFQKTIQAVRLIRKHENRSEICEPAVITVNIKDKKIASIAEAIIPMNTLNAVVVKNRHDYNEMSRYLYDVNKCTISMRTLGSGFNIEQDRIDSNVMRSLGFDGFLSDFIEGPKDMIQMLCENASINKIPISINGLRNSDKERINEMVSRGELNLVKYVSNDQIYTMNRSKFGKQQVFTNIKPIDVSRNSVFNSGLSEEQRSITNERIANFKMECESVTESANIGRETVTKILSNHRECSKRYEGAEDKVRRAVEGRKQKARINQRVSILRGQLDALRGELNNNNTNNDSSGSNGIAESIERAVVRREELVKKSVALRVKIAHIESMVVGARVALIECENWASGVERVCSGFSEEKESRRENVRVLKRQAEEARSRLHEVHGNYREHLLKLGSAGTKAMTEQMKSWVEGETPQPLTRESVVERVGQLESELRLLSRGGGGGGGGGNAVERLAANEDHVRAVEARVDVAEEKVSELRTRVEAQSNHWRSQLDTVVRSLDAAFGVNMARLASGGGVALVRSGGADGDRDSNTDTGTEDSGSKSGWALEVQVSFRDGQTPTALSGATHSGGEKSATTAMFVDALMQVADGAGAGAGAGGSSCGGNSTPFRVVDEINQGLDARNERKVHGCIVEGASAAKSAQYFLITPKLLVGLAYSTQTTVHCIFAGGIAASGIAASGMGNGTTNERCAGVSELDHDMGVVARYSG